MAPTSDPTHEESFVLLNHMLDDILNNYRQHGILNYPVAEQTQLIYNNPHLRGMSVNDLVSFIAIMAVRLFETEPPTPPEA
jgi:hypothetical protein